MTLDPLYFTVEHRVCIITSDERNLKNVSFVCIDFYCFWSFEYFYRSLYLLECRLQSILYVPSIWSIFLICADIIAVRW